MTLDELLRFIGVVMGAASGYLLVQPYGIILAILAVPLGAVAGFFGGWLVVRLFSAVLKLIIGAIEFFWRRFR